MQERTMQRGLLWTTFATVFLTELGDKIQLAAMTASAKGGALVTVFLAASAALVRATGIGAAVGGALFRVVPEAAIRYLAGAFIAVGIWVTVKG
jgi:putative Ca2+/H+ antiporter (TMEM165/GDT1 family)